MDAPTLSPAVQKLGAIVDSFSRFVSRFRAWGHLGALKASVEMIEEGLNAAREAQDQSGFDEALDRAGRAVEYAQAHVNQLRDELAARS